MSESRAAIRYAKAILDLAVENKATDALECGQLQLLSPKAKNFVKCWQAP